MKIESFGEEKNDINTEENAEGVPVKEDDLPKNLPELEDPELIIEKTADESEDSGEEDLDKPEQEFPFQEWEDIGDVKIERWSTRRTKKKLVEILQDWDGVDASVLDSKHLDDLIDHLIELIIRDRVDDLSESGGISDIPEIKEMWSSAEFLQGIIRCTTEFTTDTFIRKNNLESGAEAHEVEDESATRSAKLLRRKLFNICGLNPREAGEVWDAINTRKNYSKNIEETANNMAVLVNRTLGAMVYLESQSRGSVKTLHEKYGIRLFGRYEFKKLIEQAQGKIKKPLKILYTTTHDENGAFDNMATQLRAVRGDFVVIEGATLMEVGRRLVRLGREHGEIETLIIAGHGNPKGVRMSESEGLLKSQVEKSKGTRRLVERKIFSENISIIFSSCSTGVEDGIAPKFDEAVGVGARTQAPDFDSYGIHKRSRITGKVKYKDYIYRGRGGKKDWKMITRDAVEY
ncbi:hypothetical protein KKH05_02535 [Patescibacteria group bacterium]|nr:hypothetical protein [Patescibacteria group bacterium]